MSICPYRVKWKHTLEIAMLIIPRQIRWGHIVNVWQVMENGLPGLIRISTRYHMRNDATIGGNYQEWTQDFLLQFGT
jgi:hypothetical protein